MNKSNKIKEVTPGISLKKAYKPGDLGKLQQKLWRAVDAAEAMLYAEGVTFSDQVRAIHALTQAAASYAKLLETADLQAQITSLQDELLQIRQAQGLRKAG